MLFFKKLVFRRVISKLFLSNYQSSDAGFGEGGLKKGCLSYTFALQSGSCTVCWLMWFYNLTIHDCRMFFLLMSVMVSLAVFADFCVVSQDSLLPTDLCDFKIFCIHLGPASSSLAIYTGIPATNFAQMLLLPQLMDVLCLSFGLSSIAYLNTS